MNKLAIIIPAYKLSFLDKALESIANQTCKDFTLYIGDDASPYDLYSIVKKYKNQIDIKYCRFEDNVGGKDLVAQWERCIALAQTEEWLWLFSDDDEMGLNCVERFYKQIEQHKDSIYDTYHFNVKIIDESSNLVSIPRVYPKIITSIELYSNKLLGKLSSLVVENIFSREIYNKMGGFQNFDLAWGSDTATWVKFGQDKGICTIDDAWVKWRRSTENITPNFESAIVSRKIKALNAFFSWSHTFFGEKKYVLMYVNCRAYINRMKTFYKYVPNAAIHNSLDVFVTNYKLKFLLKYFLLLFIHIKNRN